MVKTKIILFDSEKKMQKGIEKMEQDGWSVSSTEYISGEFGCFKTGCYGCLFLPLALLGKRKGKHKVTFTKKISPDEK